MLVSSFYKSTLVTQMLTLGDVYTGTLYIIFATFCKSEIISK